MSGIEHNADTWGDVSSSAFGHSTMFAQRPGHPGLHRGGNEFLSALTGTGGLTGGELGSGGFNSTATSQTVNVPTNTFFVWGG